MTILNAAPLKLLGLAIASLILLLPISMVMGDRYRRDFEQVSNLLIED